MRSSILLNLRSLSLTLAPIVDDDFVFPLSHLALQRLHLFYLPFSANALSHMKNYILAARHLLEVKLVYPIETTASDLTDLFLTLSIQSDLTDIAIFIEDSGERMPPLSRQALDSILDRNKTATTLIFASDDGKLLTDESYLIMNRSKSLFSFEFCSFLRPAGLPCLIRRDESQWNRVTTEAGKILLHSRILSAIRRAPLRLPLEIISYILVYSVAQSSLWIKEQLDVIFRCLRDRRTLRKVRSEVVKFDKNVLFVRCKRALA